MNKLDHKYIAPVADNLGDRRPWPSLASLKKLTAASGMQALYDQMLVSGVNFLTLVFLGRSLEIEQFGFFVLAYMSILGLASLHTALITQPFGLQGATRPASKNLGHLHSLLRLHAWAWLPLNVAMLALVSWKFFPDRQLFVAAAVYLCVFFLQELLRRYWYTCGEIGPALVNDFISYGGQLLAILLWATYGDFDAAAALWAMAATSLLALGHAWYRLRKQPVSRMPVQEVVRTHWRTGAWLLLAAISAYGALQLYPYMIAGLGASAVAAFAAARAILNALNVLAQAGVNYLPLASKRILERAGAASLTRHLVRSAVGMFTLATLFCAAVSVEAPTLLQWIYGRTFDGAAEVIVLLSFAGIISVLFPVLYAGILVLHQAPVIFISNVIATVFNVTVGWWLVRQYGIHGAAVAAGASALLVLAIQVWCLKAALGNLTTHRFLKHKPCMP